jgi:hypothetical protein
MPPKGLLSWITPFLLFGLFWRAVGIHPNTPLTPFHNKILQLIQEDITIKTRFFNVTK